jgi:hypothetical protein
MPLFKRRAAGKWMIACNNADCHIHPISTLYSDKPVVIKHWNTETRYRANGLSTNKHISIEEGREHLRKSATHTQLVTAVRGYLSAMRIPHTLSDAARCFNSKGQIVRRIDPNWPDITACAPSSGVLLAIEVKAGKDTLTPGQAHTLHLLYLAGALVVVARSVEDVEEVLKTRRIRSRDIDEICLYKDKPHKRKSSNSRRRVARSRH